MSLINQMLQDLEKRRASATERGALPHQVRVLPHSEKSKLSWWIAGAAFALAALAAWQFTIPRTVVPVVTVTPEAPAVVSGPDAKYLADGPASRLALDIANAPIAKASAVARPAAVAPIAVAPPNATGLPPATANVAGVKPPVAAAAVIGKDAPKPATGAAEIKPGVATPTAAATMVAANPRSIEVNAETRASATQTNQQIDKRVQQLTPAQTAENEYREAANFTAQGRLAEAQESFRQALLHNPAHIGARQGLFGLLVEARRNGDAEQLLRDGLKLNANQPGFAMALARLQLDRGDAAGAIETLQGSVASAQNSPDYLAFYAALLQRQTRHREAAEQYQAALRLAPQSGVWLMGLGISLQALNRNADAQDAYRRAKNSNSLSAELQAFVDQRLRQLQ